MFKPRPSDAQAAHIEAKISELTRKNRAKDQEIARLRKELKAQNHDAERLPKLRIEFENRIEDLKDVIASTTNTALSIENRAIAEENAELADNKRSLQLLLRDLEDELANAKQDRLNANESLRQLQENAFRGQDQLEWGTDTHESIAAELDTLFKDARTWCKNNCIHELPPGFSGTIGEWHPEWREVVFPHQMILKHERLPVLLLHALLMNRIYRQIFARPFFSLPWRKFQNEDQKVDPEGHDTVVQRYQFQVFLEKILGELLQGNPEGGHAWRSQLLRLLDPRLRGDGNERPQLGVTKDRSHQAHEEAAKYMMRDFVTGSAAPLISKPPNEAQAAADLERIFQIAVRMAHKLWLRRSCLEIRTLDHLPRVFKYNEALLRPHALHTKALTDDPAALDGQPVLLVVHPAILVRGKSDGTEYDNSRILKAAVVWMG